MKFLTKVVPISKNTWSSLDESNIWKMAKKRGQPYLHIQRFDPEEQAYLCDVDPNTNDGDFFLESDLIPYEEPKQQSVGNGRFIELYTTDNEPILINKEKIHAMFPHSSGCKIMYAGEDSYVVTESYEAIKQMLTDKGLML